MMNQTSILVVVILVMGLYFYAVIKIDGLKRRYHNDERWQQICLRANRLVKYYYESLIVAVAIVMVWSLFASQKITLSLNLVLLIFTLVICLGSFIEYLAVKHFDRVF
ncbi:hypothetical protein RA086_08200 [Lactiplantibacillus sp. WILCCON 0030]|uniref:Integral membrane protein n=1 Tax=Lactiplantibacillus brownii TaxID=3069269 RepID=A0ABU1A9F4_9LACO|nr:hypothetical protein [Lactiplantibacillus brownii]MDQ7937611.1 hypothetical protein [Lactiplantibacillus brownii]